VRGTGADEGSRHMFDEVETWLAGGLGNTDLAGGGGVERGSYMELVCWGMLLSEVRAGSRPGEGGMLNTVCLPRCDMSLVEPAAMASMTSVAKLSMLRRRIRGVPLFFGRAHPGSDVDFGLLDDVSVYYHSLGLDGGRAEVHAEEGPLLLLPKSCEWCTDCRHWSGAYYRREAAGWSGSGRLRSRSVSPFSMVASPTS